MAESFDEQVNRSGARVWLEDNTDRKLRRLWLKLLSRCVFRQMGEDLPLAASGVGAEVGFLGGLLVFFGWWDWALWWYELVAVWGAPLLGPLVVAVLGAAVSTFRFSRWVRRRWSERMEEMAARVAVEDKDRLDAGLDSDGSHLVAFGLSRRNPGLPFEDIHNRLAERLVSAASQAVLERLLSLDVSAVSDTVGFSKLVRLLFSADELREASKRPGVVEAAALSWLAHHPESPRSVPLQHNSTCALRARSLGLALLQQ